MSALRTQLATLAVRWAVEQSGATFDSGHCESEIMAGVVRRMLDTTPDAELGAAIVKVIEDNEWGAVSPYTRLLRAALTEQGLEVPGEPPAPGRTLARGP